MDIGGTGEIADIHEIRKYEMWPHFMAGGFGVELYFGYRPVHNDLDAEDFRSRERSWGYARNILKFFHSNNVPYWEMESHNILVGNESDDNSKYCFAQLGKLYLVYLPEGGSTSIDLSGASGSFKILWYDPRNGGKLQTGSLGTAIGGGVIDVGSAPSFPNEDWLVVIKME